MSDDGLSDGAHTSAMPSVPCPHDTTGKPAVGGGPLGTATTPVTATYLFCRFNDEYMTRYIVPCRPATATFCALISLPFTAGDGSGDRVEGGHPFRRRDDRGLGTARAGRRCDDRSEERDDNRGRQPILL